MKELKFLKELLNNFPPWGGEIKVDQIRLRIEDRVKELEVALVTLGFPF